MTTTIEYALLAGTSYYDTRTDINRFPLPQDWGIFSRLPEDAKTGFEASVCRNPLTNEIVISYAGTNGDGGGIFTNPDKQADAALAGGLGSAQLLQAVEYYLQVKAANTINGVAPNITLTGHSLGGGLAALVAVFFNETARTFDQAPFRSSANAEIAVGVRLYLSTKFPGSALAPLDAFILSFAPFGLGSSQDGLAARETKVSNINVQGEFLSTFPWNLFNRIGTQSTDIPDNTNGVTGDDLHAQSLLTAYLQSKQAAAPNKALNEVTIKLPDLLKMIFDKNLFAYLTNDPKFENFLERLVKHEAGVHDPATGATTIAADAMLTRFTADLWQIAQDGGLTMSDKNLSDALTAFAMQMYYEDTANVTDPDKHLFDSTGVSGGLHFDRNDVAATLADAKGYTRYFVNYLATLLPTERLFITQQLPDLRDWYIQAGRDALNATAGTQRASFMFGGTGDAAPTGNDLLIGGAGRDIYLFNQGYGIDRIYDDDDSGPEKSILFLGAGVDKDAIKLRKGSLLIDLGNGDQIHIADFDANDPLANPTFDTFQFADGVTFTWNDLLAKGFDLDGSEADDTLIGSGVEDRIDGKGGNDWLWRLRDTGKTRRWQHGDKRTHTSSNDAHWRIAA